MRNVRLRARHYHFYYELGTQRLMSDTEAVVIPGKINIIASQVPPTTKGKTPEVPALWGILRRDSRNRASYRYESVIGGAQCRQDSNINRRIKC